MKPVDFKPEIDPLSAPSNRLSRAFVQRTEIGPMLHQYGHEVFDTVEAEFNDGFNEHLWEIRFKEPKDTRELSNFARKLAKITNNIAQGLLASPKHHLLGQYLREKEQPNFTISAEVSVQEGFTSSIVAPLNLYRTIKAVEERPRRSAPVIEQDICALQSVDSQDIARRITEPGFITMLRELGNAASGFLRGPSSDPGDIRAGTLLHCFSKEPAVGDLFEFDEHGVITGFSRQFIRKKTAFSREWNKDFKNTSSGCPVRHDTFPRTSDYTQKYLQDLDIWDGQPSNQGVSLIERGARLVSLALDSVHQEAA